MKLNIGCGKDKRIDYVNCDISKEVNPDKVFDIEKELPFKDNSINEILMFHILEHTKEPLKIMKEIYRICKNGAIVHIRVPYFSSESAFSMLDHYHFFTYTSFDMLDVRKSGHYMSVGNFRTIEKKLHWRKVFYVFELLFNLFPRVYQELFAYWFPARELNIVLEVVK